MIISSRSFNKQSSSMDDIVAKVNAMTEQQKNEYVDNAVKQMGAGAVVNLVKKVLARTTSAAGPMYEGFKDSKEEQVPMAAKTDSPSQFKQKINNAGDWLYLLVILIMVGTAGASDQGASWGQILRGFAITLGSGFLIWVVKRVASVMVDAYEGSKSQAERNKK